MTENDPPAEDVRQPFDGNPLSDVGERRAVFAVLDSFRQYRKQTHYIITHRRRQNFYALTSAHQALLTGPDIRFLDNLIAIDDAIDENADIADSILELALSTFDLPETPGPEAEVNWHDCARPLDLSKASSTIRQFWRDWSKEGFEAEVQPILDRIAQCLTDHLQVAQDGARVLLPGAGLGRLLFELCMRGYYVEGNEISYHQLMASNFVLNTASHANQYRTYPYISSFNNHETRSNQLRSVTIPDVHPATAMAERATAGLTLGEMNMTAGDFLTSYSSEDNADTFDAVATIYFIDTAPNVIRYIETIRNCLVEGGLWINQGPLLWHFEDRGAKQDHDEDDEGLEQEVVGIAEPGSFELTDDEVLALVQKMGFELIHREILDQSEGGYIQDIQSMLQSRYRCSFWVLRKIAMR